MRPGSNSDSATALNRDAIPIDLVNVRDHFLWCIEKSTIESNWNIIVSGRACVAEEFLNRQSANRLCSHNHTIPDPRTASVGAGGSKVEHSRHARQRAGQSSGRAPRSRHRLIVARRVRLGSRRGTGRG
jgi:hypothetical protein